MKHKMGAFEFLNGLIEIEDKIDVDTIDAVSIMFNFSGRSVLQLEDNRWHSSHWLAEFNAFQPSYYVEGARNYIRYGAF